MYLLPPLFLLVILVGMVALHLVAGSDTYFAVARAFVVDAWYTPFLDAHAVLAALECHGLGFNVYVLNPCDTLGRPHNYSVIWLWLSPLGLDQSALIPLGVALGLAAIAAIAILCRAALAGTAMPAGPRLAALFVACLSPAVLYALERANIDLLIFALTTVAARLTARDNVARRRLFGYSVAIGAALLKYYPLVFLATAVREKLPRCAAIVGAAALVVAAFLAAYWPELVTSLRLVPTYHWHSVAFGATVLPRGLGIVAPDWVAQRYLLMAGLGVCTLVTVLLLNRGTALRDHIAALTPAQESFLMVGAIILPACFLAGQNIAYRAMLALLVLPAALALAGRSRVFRLLAVLAVGLCWYLAIPIPHRAANLGQAGLLAWLAIQFAWWGFMAILLAIAVNMTLHSPTSVTVLAWAGRAPPSPAKRG